MHELLKLLSHMAQFSGGLLCVLCRNTLKCSKFSRSKMLPHNSSLVYSECSRLNVDFRSSEVFSSVHENVWYPQSFHVFSMQRYKIFSFFEQRFHVNILPNHSQTGLQRYELIPFVHIDYIAKVYCCIYLELTKSICRNFPNSKGSFYMKLQNLDLEFA